MKTVFSRSPLSKAGGPSTAQAVGVVRVLSPLKTASQLRVSELCWRNPSNRVTERMVCVPRAVGTGSDTSVPVGSAPPSAETARTIVQLVGSGTLSTINEDNTPLGTYVSYVLDSHGMPLLRLRRDAVHTKNLERHAACSLFVHAPVQPIRSVARVTLMGVVEHIPDEEMDAAREEHARKNSHAIGVDAPRADDLFMRLKLQRAFYVGGLGTGSAAEEIAPESYSTTSADILAEAAPGLVAYMNRERPLDIARITGDAIEDGNIDDVESAELLWVDRLGVYILANVKDQDRILRVNFAHEATDERDAKSSLTMMAQIAWENERSYQPVPMNSKET
mmetsp:Transcript_11066/g.26230  ORF Transcript_11066/g.26230 Transcript_11066/m.26230 type:complete len:335 (+) Transcript_11066:122-1126(+)